MDNVQTFVDDLRNLKALGSVEFFKTYIAHNTSVLTSVACSFAGSRALVGRVGDLCFLGSTHHLTRYGYKLRNFILVDSEGKSRTVLFFFVYFRGWY